MTDSSSLATLSAKLREWWTGRQERYEEFLKLSPSGNLPGSAGLWDGMPELDSKAIAESAPVFEEVLGVPFDPTLIQFGGYDSIEAFIESNLVIEMHRRSVRKRSKTRPSGGE